MQRLCTKLRYLALQSTQSLPSLSATRRLLHQFSPPIQFSSNKWSVKPFLNNNAASPLLAATSFPYSPLFLSLVQVRHVSSRERAKRRKPMTPRTSKLKKIKMKSYSSYKSRFRTMHDGSIRRWREGKNHNAHVKSKKSIRRLRQPALVPVAYAKQQLPQSSPPQARPDLFWQSRHHHCRRYSYDPTHCSRFLHR